jgi:hypothetical protein
MPQAERDLRNTTGRAQLCRDARDPTLPIKLLLDFDN